MFVIIDDALDDSTRNAILNIDYHANLWNSLKQDDPINSILILCNKYFNLESMIGYEMWPGSDDAPPPPLHAWRPEFPMHYDKDENLFKEKNELSFPLCSIVYYPLIKNLIGGEFYTNDMSVTPKTNRLLIFSPGILHAVKPYQGLRKVVSVNPWPSSCLTMANHIKSLS
jgi:hypothetical protein